MSRPTARELSAVSKILLLSEQETATLFQILQVLGFDVETIAFLWDKSEEVVKQLFRIDQSSCRSHRLTLTGQDLAWWCKYLRIKPGVIQQRRNFDGSKLQTRRKGLKKMPWVGPPTFAATGATLEGRTFVELACLVETLPTRSRFSSHVLSQMSVGKFPLRLPELRDLMTALEGDEIDHQKVAVIKAALAMFPEGVRTPEEVLEAMTTNERETEVPSPALNQSQITEEDSMRVDLGDRFRAEFARRGLQPKLQQLREVCAPIQQLLHEWNAAIDRPYLFPGELEVMLSSGAFVAFCRDHPNLAEPFAKLGKWLARERKKEEKRMTAKALKKRLSTSAPLVESPQEVIRPSVDVPTMTSQRDVGGKVAAKASAKPPVPPVVTVAPAEPARSVPAVPPATFVDSFGLQWKSGERVRVDAVTLPLKPLADARLEEGRQTAQKRLYGTLLILRNTLCAGNWEEFNATLTLERLWVSGLVDCTSSLTPERIKLIIDGLKTHFDLELSPRQLFGLQPLPDLGQDTDKAVVKPEGSEPLLFVLGDTLTAVRFTLALTNYRSVWQWFRRTYGLTDDHLVKLEQAKIGVPVSVHLVLMHKLKDWIDEAVNEDGPENVVIPRVYTWLLNLPATKPVKDGAYVFDEINLNKNWLKGQ